VESASQNVHGELGATVSCILLWSFCSSWPVVLQRGEGRRLFTAAAVKSRLGFSLQLQRPMVSRVHPKALPAGSVTHRSAEVWVGACLSSWEPQSKGTQKPTHNKRNPARWNDCFVVSELFDIKYAVRVAG